MEPERGLATHGRESFRCLRDNGDDVWVVGNAEGVKVLSDRILRTPAHQDFQAEVGKTLGNKALRGPDEKDRFLVAVPAPHEADFFT